MDSYNPEVIQRLMKIQDELMNINGFLGSIQRNLADAVRAIEAVEKSVKSCQTGCNSHQGSTDVRP